MDRASSGERMAKRETVVEAGNKTDRCLNCDFPEVGFGREQQTLKEEEEDGDGGLERGGHRMAAEALTAMSG